MFEIFMMVGWTLLGILLLYLWADVREVKREMKNYRRDLMRNSLGGRTSDNYPGFSEEDYWKEAREAQEKDAKKARKSAPLGALEESGEADTYLEQIARGQGNQPQEIRQQETRESGGTAANDRIPADSNEEETLGRRKTLTLKPGEEQVLREILLEFLAD